MLCHLRRLSNQTLLSQLKSATHTTQYRTIFSASSITQYASKKKGVSDEEMNRILSAVNNSSKPKSPSSKSAKEEQELEELQALLEDEEILSKQERKKPTSNTSSQPNTSAGRNKPLGTMIDEDSGVDSVEMDKMLKELGLSGRWDQYKDMVNSFDNGAYNGMNEQLVEDEGDLSFEDKNAYKLFGQNYMKSLKSEFDSPEIFNFIKNQADAKGASASSSPSGASSSGVADFASLAAATAVNSASKKTSSSSTSQQGKATTTTTPPSKNPKILSATGGKKPTMKPTGLSMDEIDKMDLNISPEEVMKDFQNPAMKKMMKEVLGVDSEEQIQKFESELKATLGQGKTLKDMEAELDREMKELDSLFGFAKELTKGGGKKKPSRK